MENFLIFDGPIVFITFTAPLLLTNEEFIPSQFLLKHRGMGNEIIGSNIYSHQHFTNINGSVKYPQTGNYNPHEIATFVVNPNGIRMGEGLNLRITALNLESQALCGYDWLKIYFKTATGKLMHQCGNAATSDR
jgi:hypothetical protein